jgi:hypothetical protein
VKAFWLIVAGVCGVAAAYFAFKSDFEKVFVVAAVGTVAWFLNYRAVLKSQLNDDHEEEP